MNLARSSHIKRI